MHNRKRNAGFAEQIYSKAPNQFIPTNAGNAGIADHAHAQWNRETASG